MFIYLIVPDSLPDSSKFFHEKLIVGTIFAVFRRYRRPFADIPNKYYTTIAQVIKNNADNISTMMNIKIKTEDINALKVLGKQLKDTGFAVIKESDTELTIPNIGRKSQNYIKTVVENLQHRIKIVVSKKA